MRTTRIVITAAVVLFVMAAPASADVARWRRDQCRYQGIQNGKWTNREESLTAACVVRHFAPTTLSNFDRIVGCESGWNRLAYNPSGPYVGLGQHLLSAWSARVRTYAPRHWDLHGSWTNSRTMLVVTARMMRAVGLSPWSCA